MFGDRFGVSPELDNLVSQASNVNLSKFKKIENQWAEAINEGKKVEGWKSSVYNPSDLDINKLGEFISTERYFEPGNRDDFSLEEYLKDK